MKTLLASIKDVPEKAGIIVRGSDDLEIALFKIDGQIFALDNRCPHMDGPLGEGEIEGGLVTCPWHGWQFQVDTGSCITMPGVDATKIDISIEGDNIYMNRPVH